MCKLTQSAIKLDIEIQNFLKAIEPMITMFQKSNISPRLLKTDDLLEVNPIVYRISSPKDYCVSGIDQLEEVSNGKMRLQFAFHWNDHVELEFVGNREGIKHSFRWRIFRSLRNDIFYIEIQPNRKNAEQYHFDLTKNNLSALTRYEEDPVSCALLTTSLQFMLDEMEKLLVVYRTTRFRERFDKTFAAVEESISNRYRERTNKIMEMVMGKK